MKPVGITMLLASLGALVVLAEEPAGMKSGAGGRVGVYDSRAIAIAFVGSPVYHASTGKKLAEMKAEHDKAKAAGNQERISELAAWGRAQQARLHQQGFSTAPVDDILKHIADQLPEITATAGVDVLVSKWDKAALARYESVERVDVTLALVRAFHPTERQLKAAIGIQEHPPIPLKEAENIDD